MEEEIREEWLIGIRLRDSAPADDYKLVEDVAPSVGDIVMVETATGTALGEVRRPRRSETRSVPGAAWGKLTNQRRARPHGAYDQTTDGRAGDDCCGDEPES